MKRNYLIKPFGAAAVAVALCLTVGVGTTLAYYTDSTQAAGTVAFAADNTTTVIEEEPDQYGKSIYITNESSSPAVVRVKLYFADENASITVYGEDWGFVGDDGWIYYNKILWGGETSTLLRADITSNGKDKALDDFGVTVVSQGVPAEWAEGSEGAEGSAAGNFDGTNVKLGDVVVIGDEANAKPIYGSKPGN